MADPKAREPEALDDDDLDPSAFKPRSTGSLGLMLAFSALALAGFLLFDLRADLAFWFGSGQPVDLGAAGAYRLERAANNVLAQAQGLPGPVASRFRRFGQSYEIVALRGTPLLVRRAFAGEDPAAKPDQAPLTAVGRLLRDDAIPEYEQAFQNLVQRGEAVPANDHLWVLLDGTRPRSGWTTPAAIAGLLAILGLNAFTLVRFFRAKAAAKAKSKK
ncbi:MAG TPA: hypothetical protein VGK67_35910 [Myxococcales bacterium]|jgi:hypothetical protein